MRKPASKDAAATPKDPAVQPWSRPPSLSRRGWWILGAVLVVLNFPVLHRVFLRRVPTVTVSLPFEDGFESPGRLEEAYSVSGGLWRIVEGRLLGPGVRNTAVWLRTDLPDSFTASFETYSAAPAEVQVSLGNGVDPFPVFQLVARANGAWRRDPTGSWSKVSDRGLTAGVTHRWRIAVTGARLVWSIDGDTWADLEVRGLPGRRLAIGTGDELVFFDSLRVVAGTEELPPASPPLASFADAFDRAQLGTDWAPTAPDAVRLSNGALAVSEARNRPVWLGPPLPANARIEFTAWTDTDGGDIKFEAWGDGKSFHAGPPTAAYRASGYVFVFGGWNNTVSVIARQDEHAADRVERSDVRVVPGRRYRMAIERDGENLTWWIDGEKFLAMRDPSPLGGGSHRHFALSGWRNPVFFDDLVISAR